MVPLRWPRLRPPPALTGRLGRCDDIDGPDAGSIIELAAALAARVDAPLERLLSRGELAALDRLLCRGAAEAGRAL